MQGLDNVAVVDEAGVGQDGAEGEGGQCPALGPQQEMLQAGSLDSRENDGDGAQTFVLGCTRPKLKMFSFNLEYFFFKFASHPF